MKIDIVILYNSFNQLLKVKKYKVISVFEHYSFNLAQIKTFFFSKQFKFDVIFLNLLNKMN